MYIKWLSRHSFSFPISIKHQDIKLHKLSTDKKNYLFDTIYTDFKKKFKDHLHIVDETQIISYTTDGFSVLLKEIDNLFLQNTGHEIDLIIIDHIQLLKYDENNKNRVGEASTINYWVNYFRQQCMNFLDTKRQVAIILLSQANRGGWEWAVKHDGSYQLTALAEANELERASSLVISVFTSDRLKSVQRAKVQLLKCRDGQTMEMSMDVFADLAYYTFGDNVDNARNTSFDGAGLESILSNTEPEDLDAQLGMLPQSSDDFDLGV